MNIILTIYIIELLMIIIIKNIYLYNILKCSLSELIKHGHNGLCFDNSDELSKQYVVSRIIYFYMYISYRIFIIFYNNNNS